MEDYGDEYGDEYGNVDDELTQALWDALDLDELRARLLRKDKA